MTNFKIFLFIFLNFIVVYSKISDLRKCANEDCSEPVSIGKTLVKYPSDDSRILSFLPNVKVKIFSKEAGSRSDLWGAEINGKRGYVPLKFVREMKILNAKTPHLVPTEGQDDPKFNPAPTISAEKPSSEPAVEAILSPAEIPIEDKISPNSVSPVYEVIDGTTLFLPPDDHSSPEYSSTPNSVDSSKVPQTENSPETIIETENITPDPKLVFDHLNSQEQSETKEKVKTVKENTNSNEEVKIVENTINKEVKIVEDTISKEEIETIENTISEEVKTVKENVISKEDNEDDDDSDLEDEEGSTGDGDEIEEDEEVETSTEAQPSTENSASAETFEEKSDIPAVESSNKGAASVISSLETVQDTADHLNDTKPLDPKPAQVEPVITETQTEPSQPIVQTITEQLNEIKEERKQENIDEIKEENKQEIVEETYANQNGVPSDLPNPLNLFRHPSKEEKDEKIVASHIQVPENLLPSTNNENQSIDDQINLTTQSSVDEFVLPINDPKETFTENPIVINDNSQPDPAENITSEQSEQKSEEIKEETVEVKETVENSSEEEIKYDKLDEPTFIDTVSDKYNSLVSEEIPQHIENNENVSDSFEEISADEKPSTQEITEQSTIVEEVPDIVEENEPGFLSKMYNSVFGSEEQVALVEETVSENVKNSEIIEEVTEKSAEQSEVYDMWKHLHVKSEEKYLPPDHSDMQSCASSDNPALCGIQNQNDYVKNENIVSADELSWSFEVPENAYNIFLCLSLTSVTVLLFTLGFYYIEKKRKDGTLIANINSLEKKLMISTKECLLLQDELKTTKERLVSIEDSSFGSNEMVTLLKEELEEAKMMRIELEDQIANLERELETAMETGMELNRMLKEILTSQSGNEHMMQNVEQLQVQLNEQQDTINMMKATLGVKNTENELLQTELTVANEKNMQLQEELDKMVVNLLSVQEEKNNIENKLEEQNEKLKSEQEITLRQVNSELNVLKEENIKLKQKIENTQRILDLKNNEFELLKQGMKEIQTVQSNKDSIMALLDVSHVKAEVQQLRDEKHKMTEKLQKEIDEKFVFEKEVQVMMQEVKILKDKCDEAEKEKVEAQTRLEVLSAYFKDKEAQLQKDINEHESKFMQKEGEATSTIERIKWIQEELQNYKAQNELLKKEILDQEVSLKSQISMLEKKKHDNWVLARQAERRLDESKQEASQLRNRLTIVEKNLNNSTHMADESKLSNRIMSPLESNGEIPVSPLHMSQVDAPASPPLLFPHRDHMTTSPPLPGLPPFMPPPPGVPFIPPPLPGVPAFMPPPPALFPGDHRLPPLGRMSSPPLHGRYSPDSRAYSPYDRDDSPPLSPSYPDSDYRRRSPPPPTSHMGRTYSPYSKPTRPPPHWERDEDRDYRGPPQRNKPRTHKGLSSGSGNSNESLDNNGRHSGRV